MGKNCTIPDLHPDDGTPYTFCVCLFVVIVEADKAHPLR